MDVFVKYLDDKNDKMIQAIKNLERKCKSSKLLESEKEAGLAKALSI